MVNAYKYMSNTTNNTTVVKLKSSNSMKELAKKIAELEKQNENLMAKLKYSEVQFHLGRQKKLGFK